MNMGATGTGARNSYRRETLGGQRRLVISTFTLSFHKLLPSGCHCSNLHTHYHTGHTPRRLPSVAV